MRSTLTPLFVAAALAASVGSAAAAPATVSTTTALHARPGMRSAVVAMIPAGAPIDARACRAWCRVSYGGAVGFVQSPLVVAAGGAAPAYYGAAPGYADPGPLGLLTAPVDAVGGAASGLFGDAYGAADYTYGAAPAGEPPVVAGY
ncbi:SH3 domain-containing protein [Methylocystis sp. S23]